MVGKEHFTIMEKHPYHGVNDTEAYSPICPKCREEEKPDAMDRTTRVTGFSQTLQCGCRYEVEPGKESAHVTFCSENHARLLWLAWDGILGH